MEALVAVGLAANVLQFVDFTAEIISISNELRNNAALSENRDHRVIATHLETLSQKISNSAQAISQTAVTASQEEKAPLQPVADKCCELAKSLFKRLDTCGIKPGQTASRLQRAKGAIKTIWNKREIREISSRLEYFRSELILHYAFQTRETQLDEQGKQPNKDDIQAILNRLDDIGPMIESVKSGIANASSIQHSELLASIAEARSENAQFHTRAVQQGHAAQSTVLQKLDCIQASMTSLNVGVQGIQHQQASAIESLAQVKVQNSTFLAGITQQVPLGNDPSSSLPHVIRPLLEEFRETFIAEIDKRFRATARSEMDNMIEQALPALDEMQHRSKATQQDSGVRVSEVTIGTCQDDYKPHSSSELQKLELPDSPTYGKIDKNRLTILYQKKWVENRLGVISLIIRDRVRFDAFGNPTEVYELTVQFNPSPCWLSSGCSIAYESRTDARGHPQFGLRLQSHRVLDTNHEVWETIAKGDISRIRDMLSQKIISTSDRAVNSATPLHYAVEYGELEICKVLVQSGADINAHDCCGFSPLGWAFLPCCIWTNQHIFHYLLSSRGADLESSWMNDHLIVQILVGSMMLGPRHQRQQTIDQHMRDWMSICRFVDLDLNGSSGCGKCTLAFLEVVVSCLSIDGINDFDDLDFRFILFDAFIRLGVGATSSVDTLKIPVVYTASIVRSMLDRSFKDSLIATGPSPLLSVFYRGYYVHPKVARNLTFLEYVISKGIAQHPDSIFDTLHNKTLFCIFNHSRWRGIWEEILKEHDFDLDWVYEERERRKRVITGETTAHEVNVDIDVSKALEMKRRGYENLDD
ncbi:hypothetical protein F4806DRAFT_507573 [Annulohypoxylon nitens]|nr:hypothetical protein F4806DRAFT_507573 [Annulohypoxylon nitens]